MPFGDALCGLVKDDFLRIALHISGAHDVRTANAPGWNVSVCYQLFDGRSVDLENCGSFLY